MSSTPSDALVVFGVTGDLAHKMIFPALYAMEKSGELNVPVIGVAFQKWSMEQLQERIEDSLKRCKPNWPEDYKAGPCFLPYDADRGIYNIRVIAPTGLSFRNGRAYTVSKKFAMLDIENAEEFFSQTVAIFQERYGKPTKIRTTVQVQFTWQFHEKH